MFAYGLSNLVQDPAYGKKLNGYRIGLLTTPASVGLNYESSIACINKNFHLSCLFAPEHGIYGNLKDGESFTTTVDKETGLPVYCLYGENLAIFPESSMGTFDACIVDIQDLGLRFYTFITTLKQVMYSLAGTNKPLFVLDRPLVAGRYLIEGNILASDSYSMVGPSSLPVSYGMTIGELALFLKGFHHIDVDLTVVPMKGYRKTDSFTQLGRKWIPTSPAIPSEVTALTYAGTCLFEGTNISAGRGTYLPFRQLGAPFINAEQLSKTLNATVCRRTAITTPTHFIPMIGKYAGKVCNGAIIHILDQKKFAPVAFAIRTMELLLESYPKDFSFENEHMDRLMGKSFRNDIEEKGAEKLLEDTDDSLATYRQQIATYSLYRRSSI